MSIVLSVIFRANCACVCPCFSRRILNSHGPRKEPGCYKLTICLLNSVHIFIDFILEIPVLLSVGSLGHVPALLYVLYTQSDFMWINSVDVWKVGWTKKKTMKRYLFMTWCQTSSTDISSVLELKRQSIQYLSLDPPAESLLFHSDFL